MKTVAVLTDSFARPANTTQYADGDLVANNATAGSVVPLEFDVPIGNGKDIRIRSVRLAKSDTDLTAADFVVNFYASEPTSAAGDNAAYSTDTADFFGSVAMSAMRSFSDGDVVIDTFADAESPTYHLPSSKIYALIEADGTYTPASGETFTVTIVVEFI